MKKALPIIAAAIGVFAFWFVGKPRTDDNVKMVEARFVVDDEVIKSKDVMRVIDPIWAGGNIYDSHAEYKKSLLSFTREQILIYAVMWYSAEVNNGGHHQFYFNSTGIVWKDALDGLKTIGASEAAENLEKSFQVFGGSPSYERDERIAVLENKETTLFESLDTQFYELDPRVYELMLKYVIKNKSRFYFDKVIRVPENMAPNK